MVYGLIIFLVMWYVVVPAIDPVMGKLNAAAFAVAHTMWGAVLGLILPQVSGAPEGLQRA